MDPGASLDSLVFLKYLGSQYLMLWTFGEVICCFLCAPINVGAQIRALPVGYPALQKETSSSKRALLYVMGNRLS